MGKSIKISSEISKKFNGNEILEYSSSFNTIGNTLVVPHIALLGFFMFVENALGNCESGHDAIKQVAEKLKDLTELA